MRTRIPFFVIVVALLLGAGASAQAATIWKPVSPDGYKSISWAGARGISTFAKIPDSNGSIDYITIVYLPYNEVRLIGAPLPMADWGLGQEPFATDTVHDWAVARFVSESAKTNHPEAKFIWNAPFFNVTVTTTDLSMAIKTTVGTSTIISSGSRPPADIAQPRKMLLINNAKGTARINEFDANTFVSPTSGDEGFESFSPNVAKNDGTAATGRLFIGTRNNGKELVIYCSRQASVAEASQALSDAGVSLDNQLEADGGGSAMCGYNMTAQYFVEPNRTLPYVMGAVPIIGRAVVTLDKLNIRKGPGAKYPIVAHGAKNQQVKIYEEKNGWARIAPNDQWVLGSYLKKQ